MLEDSTFYTQVNMTRTIEQILGLTPMNQFDLTASPMTEIFVDNPPEENFKPWTHVSNGIPLNLGVTQTPMQPIPVPKFSAAATPEAATAAPAAAVATATPEETAAVKALRTGWMKKKTQGVCWQTAHS